MSRPPRHPALHGVVESFWVSVRPDALAAGEALTEPSLNTSAKPMTVPWPTGSDPEAVDGRISNLARVRVVVS